MAGAVPGNGRAAPELLRLRRRRCVEFGPRKLWALRGRGLLMLGGTNRRGAVVVGLAALLFGVSGCYTYRPLTAPPVPAMRVAALLTDNGRVGAASQIGPRNDRLEGRFLEGSDTAYLLSVTAVKPIHGPWVRWTGEQVSLRRDYVATLYERRL